MTELRNLLQGLWLPLVTPFRNGELDEASLGGWSGTTPPAPWTD